MAFKPAKASLPRLSKYGCTTHTPCVIGQMCHDGNSRTTLRDALATISTGHAKMAKAKKANTPLTTKPCKISFRGPPPWRLLCQANHLPEMANRLLPRVDAPQTTPDGKGDSELCFLCLTCTSCGINKCHASRLVCKGTWVAVWCPACKHMSTARNWLCECGGLWHKCLKHAVAGLKLKRPVPKQRAKPNRVKVGALGQDSRSCPWPNDPLATTKTARILM